MENKASTTERILDVIARRRSSRALKPTPLDPGTLRTLFEAARWAASSFNEQPWTYLLVRRESEKEFAGALECLSERNRRWARRAGALLFSCARREFSRNGKPNRHAWHDVGQASAQLALQAAAMGLIAHQMAGFSADSVRSTFGIPPEWEPVAAIAVGLPGRLEDLDEEFREAETAPRKRKPQSEFVFEARWGQAATP